MFFKVICFTLIIKKNNSEKSDCTLPVVCDKSLSDTSAQMPLLWNNYVKHYAKSLVSLLSILHGAMCCVSTYLGDIFLQWPVDLTSLVFFFSKSY